MRIFDIFILLLFALPSAWHLVVYCKKPEGRPTRSTVLGIVALCGISVAYTAWLICTSRFY